MRLTGGSWLSPTWSLGNFSRSRITTLRFGLYFLSRVAAVLPAGPPPTMATSYIDIFVCSFGFQGAILGCLRTVNTYSRLYASLATTLFVSASYRGRNEPRPCPRSATGG